MNENTQTNTAPTPVDQIEGMRVITKDGRELGTIRGVDVDTKNWDVRALAVRLEKSVCEGLGIEPKLIGSYTVHVQTDHVRTVGDTVLLSTTLDELDAARREMMASGRTEAKSN